MFSRTIPTLRDSAVERELLTIDSLSVAQTCIFLTLRDFKLLKSSEPPGEDG
jgi:hypothetical protein